VVYDILSQMGGTIEDIAEDPASTELVTHVVCGQNKRTLKVLYALALGRWIVKDDWIMHSLEVGKWANELEFEAVDWFPGSRSSREARAKGEKGLFDGKCFMIKGKTQIPNKHLKKLIQLAGGQMTASFTRTHYCVVAKDAVCSNLAKKFPEGQQIPVVTETWVLDALQHHKLPPTSDYKPS